MLTICPVSGGGYVGASLTYLLHQSAGDKKSRRTSKGEDWGEGKIEGPAVAMLVGVVGNIWSFLQACSSKKPLVPMGLVVGVAYALLFFGLRLLGYILARSLNLSPAGNVDSTIFVVAVLVIFWIGWWPEAHYVPLHRLFLDQLRARVYTRIGKSVLGNATLLGNLCGANAPCAPPQEPVNKLMGGAQSECGSKRRGHHPAAGAFGPDGQAESATRLLGPQSEMDTAGGRAEKTHALGKAEPALSGSV
jgi:hypothetical protein